MRYTVLGREGSVEMFASDDLVSALRWADDQGGEVHEDEIDNRGRTLRTWNDAPSKCGVCSDAACDGCREHNGEDDL